MFKMMSKMFKMMSKKKGFNLNLLYTSVLTLVLIGMLIGAGVLALDKFSTTTGVSTAAVTALNASRDEIAGISSNWMGLIITIIIIVIIIALIIVGFSGGMFSGSKR